MKIINNRKQANIFEDLKYGQVFMCKGSVFMKIEEIQVDYGEYYNAIYLDDGMLTHFRFDDEITEVNATLTID